VPDFRGGRRLVCECTEQLKDGFAKLRIRREEVLSQAHMVGCRQSSISNQSCQYTVDLLVLQTHPYNQTTNNAHDLGIPIPFLDD
jgi:hypothetical protein